ncbi:MAG: hypothetical protein P8181_17390 [bacterium]
MTYEMTWLGWTSVAIGALFFVGLIYMAVVSFREEERRGARAAVFLAVLVPLPYLLAGMLDFANRDWVAGILVFATVLAGLVLVVPTRGRGPGGTPSASPGGARHDDDTPTTRIDERDIMFARRRLIPGTERFDAYYREHPDKKPLDDKFRSKPGLLNEKAKFFDPLMFAASEASFTTIRTLQAQVDQGPAGKPYDVDPARLTTFIKKWARSVGVVSAGVTRLEDYHKYSVIGRTEPYGEPVTLDHPYGHGIRAAVSHLGRRRAPGGQLHPASRLPRARAYRRQLPGGVPPGGARRRTR